MFDYVRFLAEITGDNTWHEAADGRLLNARHDESHFVLEQNRTTLLMNGKPIYSGPLEEDFAHCMR